MYSLVMLLAVAGVSQADKPKTDASGDPLPARAAARLGPARWRAAGEVQGLAYAPDGKTLLSVARDEARLSLWDVDGREVRSFPAERPLLSLAVSADGKTAAVGDSAGGVTVRDLTTGKVRRELAAKERSWVVGVHFAGDGLLVAATGDGLVYVWSLDTGRQLHRLEAGPSPTPPALAADGVTLAVRSEDGVALWDVKQGKKLRDWDAERLAALRFSPDGKSLAAADFDNRVYLFDPATGKTLRTIEPDGTPGRCWVVALAFAADGKLLAGVDTQRQVRVWDPASGKTLQRALAHHDAPRALAFAPDGKTFVTAGKDRVLALWDPATGKRKHVVGAHQAPLAALALSPKDRTVLTAGLDGLLVWWDPATGKALRRAEAPLEAFHSAAWTHDGKKVVAGTGSGGLLWFDAATAKPTASWEGHRGKPITTLAFTPDGKTLVSGGHDARVALWDTAKGTLAREVGDRAEGPIEGLVLLPGGEDVVVASRSALLHQHPIVVRKKELDFERFNEGHLGGVLCVATSPDGGLLASGGRDAAVNLWDSVRRRKLDELGGFKGSVGAVAFRPDGQLLASGHSDGVVRLWKMDGRRLLLELPGHKGAVRALAFAADGKTLLSAGADTTAVVWDLAKVEP